MKYFLLYRGNPFRGGAPNRPRSDYRDFRGPRDRYGSPGREMPPAKRMRQDWGDDLRANPRFARKFLFLNRTCLCNLIYYLVFSLRSLSYACLE